MTTSKLSVNSNGAGRHIQFWLAYRGDRLMRRGILATITAFVPLSVIPSWGSAQPPDAQTCLTVTIGNTQDYSCLNQAFAALVPSPSHRLSSLDAPYNATSPAPAVGTFNQTAIHQELGSNFGISAFPQRPPPPVFSPPNLNSH
jgi:hypothetical protein